MDLGRTLKHDLAFFLGSIAAAGAVVGVASKWGWDHAMHHHRGTLR